MKFKYSSPDIEAVSIKNKVVYAASPRFSTDGEDYVYDNNTYEW